VDKPSRSDIQMAADAVAAAYDAIQKMCGEDYPCPAPFDEIYSVLMRHIFTIERLRKRGKTLIP
jgi:hypothetical protein